MKENDRIFATDCRVIFAHQPQELWLIDEIVYCEIDENDQRKLKFIKMQVVKKSGEDAARFSLEISFSKDITISDFANPTTKFIYKDGPAETPFSIALSRNDKSEIHRITLIPKDASLS